MGCFGSIGLLPNSVGRRPFRPWYQYMKPTITAMAMMVPNGTS